jgi:hypothetical protein
MSCRRVHRSIARTFARVPGRRGQDVGAAGCKTWGQGEEEEG